MGCFWLLALLCCGRRRCDFDERRIAPFVGDDCQKRRHHCHREDDCERRDMRERERFTEVEFEERDRRVVVDREVIDRREFDRGELRREVGAPEFSPFNNGCGCGL